LFAFYQIEREVFLAISRT